ncbi:MAG: class I tRNA ligase family protein, partial [bacterium]|nr:class I tRNA ligase family protein [bacterium]
DAKPWSTRGIVGVRRFLEKVWHLQDKVKDGGVLNRETHALVKQIGNDITSFSLNTAVSNFMKWTNAAAAWESVSKKEFEVFLTLLSPFAPHLGQELWSKFGHTDQVHDQKWPTFDATKLVAENAEIVVQVNGKVRDKFTVASGISEEDLKAQALGSKKIQLWLAGKQPKKVIVVKGKLVSIVV